MAEAAGLVAGSMAGSSPSKRKTFLGLAKVEVCHQEVETAPLCHLVPFPWLICVGGSLFQICLVEFDFSLIGPSSWKVDDLGHVVHSSNLLHSIASKIASAPSESSGHVQNVRLCNAPMASRRIHNGQQWLCSASYRMHSARAFWMSPPFLL